VSSEATPKLLLALSFPQTLVTSVTVFRAVHVTLGRHEGSVDERCFAEGARVALWVTVPAQRAVFEEWSTCTDRFTTCYTARTEQLLVTPLTIRLSLVTDVSRTTQPFIALPTTEVLLVILVFVRCDELLSEYQLVTRMTARTQQLRVVSTAVESTVVLEVDKIHKNFLTGGTIKAARVPHSARDLICDHCTVHQPSTLLTLLFALLLERSDFSLSLSFLFSTLNKHVQFLLFLR